MKKILIVSTVSRQFYLFEQGNIEVLRSLGYEVHCAANYEDANERLDVLEIERHHFDIQRSPFAFKNIKAYRQLKRIMKLEKFDAVHCHSPMGGVLSRLAAKSVGINKVIYTAHGFHFYKGASFINWMIYYPIEKLMSKITTIIITINKEDYERAVNFKTCTIEYVPGIGVDVNEFESEKDLRGEKRKELNINENAFVILSVGELNNNKNHEVVIRALSKIQNRDIVYLICGQGKLKDYLTRLVSELNLTKQVNFLGFRNDMSEIYKVSNLFAFPSYREGLSVSLMEAMASGLPVVCTNIRGNRDLINDGIGGYRVPANNIEAFSNAILKIMENKKLSKQMGLTNLSDIKSFDKKIVKSEMLRIYRKVNIDDYQK